MPKSENEAALILGAFAICVVGLGSLALHKNTPECKPYEKACVVRVADAIKPLEPTRVPIVRVRGQPGSMTAQQRIDNTFYAIFPPRQVKPEEIWAYARRNDG